MFCKYCGAQLEDGSAFCNKCGANLTQATAAQSAPQAQPKAKKPVTGGDILQIVKTNLHYILAGIAVIALIWGILNVFSVFHVNAKTKIMGRSHSEYSSVSDFADEMDIMDSSAAAVYIGNIFFGLACLGVAAIGALYFLKKFQNMPYYDQFIGSKLKYRPAFMMGALGAAGAILQMIIYLLFARARRGGFGLSVTLSAGVNWTTWLLLVFFAVIAIVDKFLLEEKPAPAPVEAPAQEQAETPVEQ